MTGFEKAGAGRLASWHSECLEGSRGRPRTHIDFVVNERHITAQKHTCLNSSLKLVFSFAASAFNVLST